MSSFPERGQAAGGGASVPLPQSLSIDIETFSSVSLTKAGVYRYAEAPDFEIMLFGYSVNGDPVRVIDLACGETLPEEIVAAILNPSVLKWAFNAQFERVCLSRYLGVPLSPDSWRCSMVWAATLGLPLSLESAGMALGLEKQKLAEGKDLIRYFCRPCAPTRANGGRTRNFPSDSPEKWARFKEYNARDVEAEMEIQRKLSRFPVPESEWAHYRLDQRINDRGIRLDMELVRKAIACDARFRDDHIGRARDVTGLDNPNSVQQLKEWLLKQGIEAESLDKATVSELLESADGEVLEALELRRELAMSSVKKYTAMENAVCSDDRARGLIQFHGAGRTGRYAGRLIQIHNLPQNHLSDLFLARALLHSGAYDALDLLYGSVPMVFSELIRTAFVPREGCRFFVADFSAIEARIIAWLAGETWRNEVFESGGDIYCASASRMFHVPVEKHGTNAHLRQKGKIAELALGYGGSTGALTNMGALRMGVAEEELKPLVDAWRAANPKIVRLWWEIDKAAVKAVEDMTEAESRGIRFSYESDYLFIRLPSGRRLAYVRPRVEENRYGRESISYEGVGESKKWGRIQTYGPKLTENIIQATARDILAEALQRLERAGYHVVMHVHDEVVIEAEPDTFLETICALLGETPSWAPGLMLRAEGFVTDFYKKE